MSRLVRAARIVLITLPAITALAALAGPSATAESTTPVAPSAATGPAVTDYLETWATWDKWLKNTPRGGMTTHEQTHGGITLGYKTDEAGRKVPYDQVCLTLEKSVYDARGNPVDPGPGPSDGACVNITPSMTAAIASDLSTATVDAPALPLTHTEWVCPNGPPPDGDCYAVDSPGPVVSFHATWTAQKPLSTSTFCLDNPRQQLTIAERDANATAAVNGVDAGAAEAGDEGVRIAHWIYRSGCPN